MFVLDTDTLTHLLRGHARVVARRTREPADVALTAVTRIEVLRGRFDAVVKAADGEQLLLAWQRLTQSEVQLAAFAVLPLDGPSAAAFDRLLKEKRLRKIGRGDLLIAAIVLANKATLVTRNTKDFGQVVGLALENWVD